MKLGVCVLLALAAIAPQERRTFTGIITDDMCSAGDHSRMRMGPTDAECVVACVQEHDAAYVLVDGATVYQLSDQRTPERFAAKRVTIVGTLDAATRTIRVQSIAAAK